jgi:uncharacterized protein YndB with AHSA1/START domain
MSDSERTTTNNGASIETPSEREIVTERVFDAPCERVGAAFTDPEQIARWWGRRSTTTTVERLELTPGGTWRFVEHNADGTHAAFRGVYREIVEPQRIVYTFEWEGMPGHVLIDTATFEDLGERTRVIVNSLFHTTGERDGMLSAGMEIGLNESYEALDELLAQSAQADSG